MDNEYVKTIAKLEANIETLDERLTGIQGSLNKIQELVIEQNDLRHEISNLTVKQESMEQSITKLNEKVLVFESELKDIKRKVEDFPKNFKVNVFDYIWKYIALALGGLITVKITGLFQI